MNIKSIQFLLLFAFSSFSSCFSFVSSGLTRTIEAPQKIKERTPYLEQKSKTSELLDRYTTEAKDLDEKYESFEDKTTDTEKRTATTTPEEKEMSSEEYALETLINIVEDVEQQINRSDFLVKLVAYKKEIDSDPSKKTKEKTQELFNELSNDLAVGLIHTTGSFAINQGFYHFLGVKNVRNPANELVTRGIALAQMFGFSRTPTQLAAIALFLSNLTNSVIDSCIERAQWIKDPVQHLIASFLNETTQDFILDKALFFDSSDLAHNLIEKVLLSKGMTKQLGSMLGLGDDHPLLWIHSHADIGIAGMRIYRLINDAKEQTYDFDIEKIFAGLEDGSISVTEGTRIAQTLLGTIQEVTGLLQRVTKADDPKTAGTIQTVATQGLQQMRLIVNGMQKQISELNRMGAITGMAALVGADV